MGSTDDAFIKAFNQSSSRQAKNTGKLGDATANREFTIGAKQYKITEFVTGTGEQFTTTDVAMNSPVRKPNIPIQPESRTGTVPQTKQTSRPVQPPAEGDLELIELRIDNQQSRVVPAPHIPVSTFAKARDRQSQPIPVAPPAQVASKQPVSQTGQFKTQSAASKLSPIPNGNKPATRPVLSTFIPAWEVDSFFWPATCGQLDALRSDLLSNFVRSVLSEAWKGSKVVAVTQFGRGEGATTLSLCLAKWAAMFTGRVALLDGDLMKPHIANSLGLSPTQGWDEISPELPLSETAISSVRDRLVVLPIGPKGGLLSATADIQTSRDALRQLADSFELVVVDAGPMFDSAHHWFRTPCADEIDSVLIVQDVRKTSVEQITDVRRRLADHGLTQVSVVENFQSEQIN